MSDPVSTWTPGSTSTPTIDRRNNDPLLGTKTKTNSSNVTDLYIGGIDEAVLKKINEFQNKLFGLDFEESDLRTYKGLSERDARAFKNLINADNSLTNDQKSTIEFYLFNTDTNKGSLGMYEQYKGIKADLNRAIQQHLAIRGEKKLGDFSEVANNVSEDFISEYQARYDSFLIGNTTEGQKFTDEIRGRLIHQTMLENGVEEYDGTEYVVPLKNVAIKGILAPASLVRLATNNPASWYLNSAGRHTQRAKNVRDFITKGRPALTWGRNLKWVKPCVDFLASKSSTLNVWSKIATSANTAKNASGVARVVSLGGAARFGTMFGGRVVPGLGAFLSTVDVCNDWGAYFKAKDLENKETDPALRRKLEEARVSARNDALINTACTATGAVIGACFGGPIGACVGAGIGNLVASGIKFLKNSEGSIIQTAKDIVGGAFSFLGKGFSVLFSS